MAGFVFYAENECFWTNYINNRCQIKHFHEKGGRTPPHCKLCDSLDLCKLTILLICLFTYMQQAEKHLLQAFSKNT